MLENDDNNVPPLQLDPKFEDEDAEAETAIIAERLRKGKQQFIEPVDENSSTMNLYRKDTTFMAIVVGKSGKTLEGIGKELDGHFLKAYGCIKEIVVLIDIIGGDTLLWQNSGRYDSKATYCVLFRIMRVP
ncbi:hypothetical protein VNO78_22852 [Psophocarpus tetragonolobus]|uniref:Uncharacterized protein n=1 Tax=Psophocarpus tetragonolobus TaxID=3891 RepID=A0AAN9XDX1_PSOTE